MKSWVFVGVSMFIASASPVLAQAAPSDSPTASSTAEDNSGDIIVTANKREERLQDVAASITAVSAENLEKLAIASPKDFGQVAPSLNFQAADEARLFNFSIRGIGTETFSVGVEPSVSTIVDGVVYTRVGSIFDGLSDLERVEVLNGPQGTLQGKNASAGAVVITTKAPNRDELQGRLDFGLAEHNEFKMSAMVTGPISDKLAFRLNGYYHREDGVVRNVANGQTVNNAQSYGARGKLLFTPSESVKLTLAADYGYRKADCCAEPIRVAGTTLFPTTPGGANTVPGNVTAAFTGTPVGPENRLVNFNTVQEGYQKNGGVSLQGDIEIGDHTLTSITAFRLYRDFAIRDRDGTPAPFTGVTPQQLFSATVPGITAADALARMQALLVNPMSFACRTTSGGVPICGESNSLERSDTFSQELRIASPSGGTFDYIVGAYMNISKVERDLTIAGVRSNIAGNVSFPTPTTVSVDRATAYVLADAVIKVKNSDYALFANVNVRPVDRLTVSGGVRFVHDRLDYDIRKVTGPNGDHIGGGAGTNPAGQPAPGANIGTPQFNTTRKYSDSHVLGKVSAKYEFTPDLMVYASWAHGYKSQAVDADIFVSQAGFDAFPVAPETSNSWEAGFKSSWLDRRVIVNVTAYKTTFSGYQTSSSGLDPSAQAVLRSAGKLFTKGIEGEITVRPIDGLKLSGNFLFADNKFGDLFLNATTNIKGGDPLNAPETKWGISGSYDLAAGDWGINLSANYTHTGNTLFTDLASALNQASIWRRPSFGVANMAVTVSAPEDRYKVSIYVKNLFNEHYVAGLRRISGSVGGGGAVAQALPRDFDRYVGATFTANF
jgi:iron complex outermembrane recepter protein